MPASPRAARSRSATSIPRKSSVNGCAPCRAWTPSSFPGGFGRRGTEGKIAAIRHARENGIPFLGICLGMQLAVVEFARHVAGMNGAHSSEFDQDTPVSGGGSDHRVAGRLGTAREA
jgi:hypothetical protein